MTLRIREKDVREVEDWFEGYVQLFKTGDEERQRNITLKEEHTRRVCTEIGNIGRHLGLDVHGLLLADVITRLHDIGRFEQYSRYGTFMDRDSENHAGLGLTILDRYEVLRRFDKSVRDLIVCAIRYHNRATLLSQETSVCCFLSKSPGQNKLLN